MYVSIVTIHACMFAIFVFLNPARDVLCSEPNRQTRPLCNPHDTFHPCASWCCVSFLKHSCWAQEDSILCFGPSVYATSPTPSAFSSSRMSPGSRFVEFISTASVRDTSCSMYALYDSSFTLRRRFTASSTMSVWHWATLFFFFTNRLVCQCPSEQQLPSGVSTIPKYFIAYRCACGRASLGLRLPMAR